MTATLPPQPPNSDGAAWIIEATLQRMGDPAHIDIRGAVAQGVHAALEAMGAAAAAAAGANAERDAAIAAEARAAALDDAADALSLVTPKHIDREAAQRLLRQMAVSR